MNDRSSILAEKIDICSRVMTDEPNGAPVPPIYQNSLFVKAEHGSNKHKYTRDTNPTIEYTEEMIARLEHAEKALCFSSGMGAIAASIMTYLSAGDHVVAMKNIYGPSGSVLEGVLGRYGVNTTRTEGCGVEDFEAVITPKTRLFYIESPSYLFFEIVDIRAITALAKRKGIITIMDNTWSTPIFQNPLDFGVDIVVHSASKYMGGHSDIVAGVACGRTEIMTKMHQETRNLLGASMDPHQAWLLLRGLRTLPYRMLAHESNAIKVAEFLKAQSKVWAVNYPGLKNSKNHELAQNQMCGFSGLLSFAVRGDGDALISKFERIHTGPSWGGFESLAVSFGNAASGNEGGESSIIRLSVGLESPETIIDDLRQAFERV